MVGYGEKLKLEFVYREKGNGNTTEIVLGLSLVRSIGPRKEPAAAEYFVFYWVFYGEQGSLPYVHAETSALSYRFTLFSK